MEALADLSRETVNLGLLDGSEVVVINTVESPQEIPRTVLTASFLIGARISIPRNPKRSFPMATVASRALRQ
jgi:DNA-binding IclR family transcriptional regulator